MSLAHAMSHFFQLLLAPLFPLMKDDLGVSYAALGFLVAVFFTISAVCQPLAGFIVDRYGARDVLLGGMGLYVLGIFIAGASGNYALIAAGVALAGLGNSVFHPADFAILNARISAPRLAYAFSAHGVAGYVGFAVAPVFSVGLGTAFGWQAALLAGAGLGVLALALLIAKRDLLQVKREAPSGSRTAFTQQARVLLSAPVLLCFLYFVFFAAGFIGLQSFSVPAVVEQYGVTAAFASGVLTAYLLGAGAGIVAGGIISAHTDRHGLVGAGGMSANGLLLLFVAMHQVPAAGLVGVFALAGFFAGVVAPSRDLMVRAATPKGAAGRVFGFVYAGLDVGSFAMPVAYGWLMDHQLPQAVFYTAGAFAAASVAAILMLPGRSRPAPAT